MYSIYRNRCGGKKRIAVINREDLDMGEIVQKEKFLPLSNNREGDPYLLVERVFSHSMP